MTAARGRPRKPITDAAEIHVAVKLPPWIVEQIDTTGQPRGTFVARLFLERLLQMTSDKTLISKLCDAIYG
jgi:hypothetical protein